MSKREERGYSWKADGASRGRGRKDGFVWKWGVGGCPGTQGVERGREPGGAAVKSGAGRGEPALSGGRQPQFRGGSGRDSSGALGAGQPRKPYAGHQVLGRAGARDPAQSRTGWRAGLGGREPGDGHRRVSEGTGPRGAIPPNA